jgi:hypothetical protein
MNRSRLFAVLLAVFVAVAGAELHALESEPNTSAFERPPGVSDAQWKDLAASLAKAVPSAQALRPQDEPTFGQGDGTTFMQFGRSLAVSGSTLVVGAPAAVSCVLTTSSCGGGVGAVYVYGRVAGAWQFRQKLRASDYTYASTTNRNFGASVAVDGDTLLVGAGGAFDQVVAPSNSIGAVYVFTRTAGTWTETQKLLPPTPVLGTDEFGFSVALRGDTAVIGNPGRTVSGAAAGGAVHVFTRSGGSFTQAALLTASDPAAGNRLGEAVAYSGNTILAGAPLGDAPTPANSGAAYVYTGSGATWTEQAKLIALDPLANAAFGNSVDLDGDSAVIGAVGWFTPPNAPNQGRAYVYTRSGSTWSQQQRLEAGDAQANRFGQSVSIRGDQIAIGARDTREGGGTPGAVRLFARSGGTWALEQSLLGPAQTSAGLGVAVRLIDDGGTPALLASSVNSADSSGIEFIRTWRRTGATPTPFVLASDLTRRPSTAQAFFGAVVAVEGDLAVVGVPAMRQPTSPVNLATQVGVAYVYARSGGLWTLRQALTINPLGGDTAAFGAAVAISGNTIAVSAPRERAAISGNGTGVVYVYTIGPSSIDLQQRIAIDNVSASSQDFGRSVSLDGDTLAVGAPFTFNPPVTDSFGRVFVYTRSAGVWTKQQEIVDTTPPGTNGEFGNVVIVRGNDMVIGVRPFQTSGFVPYVAVATRSGSTWSIVQRILEPSGTSIVPNDGEFGRALAWSGTTLAIGAARHGGEAGSSGNGRVYLYAGTPGSFALGTTLRQTDGTVASTGSRYGAALALDGDRLLVSAPQTSFLPGTGPLGAAYSYERVGGSWRQVARLRGTSPDDTVFSFSGPLTSPPQGGSPLAFAGTQLLIGVPLSNGQAPFAAQNVGAVLVFGVPRATSTSVSAPPWAPLGVATAVGFSVSAPNGPVSGSVRVDASSGENCTATLAAGSCTLTFTSAGTRTVVASFLGGPAFGQSRSPAATIVAGPAQTAIIGDTPALPTDGDAGDQLGTSVAMTETLIVVGAAAAGPGSAEGPGAVHVYTRTPPNAASGGGGGVVAGDAKAALAQSKALARIAVLRDSAVTAGQRFGQSVAVSADGSRIVVGSPNAAAGVGRVQVYQRGGPTWTDRSAPDQLLAPSPAPGETVQRFGESVAVDAVGNVVVGAPRTDRPGQTDAGAAYVFDAAGIQRAALAAATPTAGDLYGAAVAAIDARVLVGAPGVDAPGQTDRGAVFAFAFDGSVATPTQTLVPSNAAANLRFGAALAVADTLLAVGTPGAASNRGGGNVFQRSAGDYSEIARLAGNSSLGAAGGGESIAISRFAAYLGAPTLGTSGGFSNAGGVLVFRPLASGYAGTLTERAVLVRSSTGSGDRYGSAVAASTTGLVVGAPFADVALEEGPPTVDAGLAFAYVDELLLADGLESQ